MKVSSKAFERCTPRLLNTESVQVETPGPQYNLFVVLFGASVHDAGAVPPQDYTIAYTCAFV